MKYFLSNPKKNILQSIVRKKKIENPVINNRNQPINKPKIKTIQTIEQAKKAGIKVLEIKQTYPARQPLKIRPAVVSKRHSKSKLIQKAGPLFAKKKLQDRIAEENKGKVLKLKGLGKGRLLIMVACGPSVNEIKDIKKLQEHQKIDIMIINKPDQRIEKPRFWVFCDFSQYNRNKEYWEKYTGIVLNPLSMKIRKASQVLLKHKHGKGFSLDLTEGYHIGRSTTFANMQAALWMDYDKIYIFGCDMTSVGGSLHRYGVNPDVKEPLRLQRFKYEAEHYDHAAKILQEELRKRFVFCSSYNPFPFVEKFEKADHKNIVPIILKKADELKNKEKEEK